MFVIKRMMMPTYKRFQDELLSDTCWVYVQKDEGGSHIIGITYCEDFFRQEISQGRPILLWRRFEDTLSAAGYRIVLNNLPESSLLKEINKYNGAE